VVSGLLTRLAGAESADRCANAALDMALCAA